MERLGGAGQAGVAARVAERFKLLIGEPVPPDFLALAPLAGHRDALERCGIHTATDLSRTRDAARSSADDLKKALIDLARPWAVAAPGWDEISRWRDFFLLLPPAGSLPAELNEGTALTGTRRH